MTQALHSGEPGGDRLPRPSWSAFLALGFRPLYLAGCAWAAVSLWVWVFAPAWLMGRLPGVFWHAHEMLWGFVATIAVGFLFTAGTNWTGVNPLQGRALGALCLLWVAARIGFLVPGDTAFVLAAACDVGVFVWAAAALARAVALSRNRRNAGVPVLVLALGLTDAAYLWAAWQGDYAALMPHFHTGMLCMAIVTLLVARRVIPFFAMRAVPGLAIPMHTRSGQVQLAAGALAVGCGLAGWSEPMAALLALAGGIALWQAWAWRPWAVRHEPLLWVLYVGFIALGIGLLVAAAYAAGWMARSAWPVHVIGVGGFSVLIMGMVTRTALGHLGRPLRADRPMVWCYALMIAAAVLRLLALVPGPWTLGTLHAAAGAWVLAFVLYLWRFAPLLVRPRADALPTVATPARVGTSGGGKA